MNLVRLEWVCRQLPGLADIADLRAAVLAAGAMADPVLVEPRFGAWLSKLIRLLDRRAHELLPDGDFRATCTRARTFALAVRCLNPSAAGEITKVRVEADGTVALPGAGMIVELPKCCAGVTVRIRASAVLDPSEDVVGPPGVEPGAALVHVDEKPPAVTNLPAAIAGPVGTEAPMVRPAVRQPPAEGWAQRWVAAGGRLHPGRTESDWLLGSTPELARVLAELGCPNGVQVNKLADVRQRADPSIDHLSLLFVRDRERYDDVVAQLDAAPDGDVRQVLLGHRAYVEGEMRIAAARYADVLVRHPHDADLWRDFTFAVRHLGDPLPAETWLFHAEEVVVRAMACVPDPAPLARLVSMDRRHESSACQFVLGLLEWVRHDLDRR